jgi:agmatine deiminase
MTGRWPAEWSTHLETLVVWPGRPEVWEPHLVGARREFRHLVEVIAHHEPVRVIVPSLDPATLRDLDVPYANPNVKLLDLATDDSWARDIAPLFVQDATDAETAMCFRFNGWGGKFTPHCKDAAFGRRLAEVLGVPHRDLGLVLEGGSLDVDGLGTAIAVEPTILNDNRNPGATRAEVEALLRESLGVETVIWLPYGLIDDVDTDGHVDNVARFVAPGHVIAQARGGCKQDDEQLAENLAVIKAARDFSGARLHVIEMPWLPYSDLGSPRPASYCNFYFVNGAVLLPITGSETDGLAATLLHDATQLPVVPIHASLLAHGGGGVHCVAMPRFARTTERNDQYDITF